MTNLLTNEILFLIHSTKIGTDENKAIYSIQVIYGQETIFNHQYPITLTFGPQNK